MLSREAMFDLLKRVRAAQRNSDSMRTTSALVVKRDVEAEADRVIKATEEEQRQLRKLREPGSLFQRGPYR